MIKSMTGYGRAEETIGDKTYLVELKSLNGKQFDVNMKMPPLIKPYEFDIRTLLKEELKRGSIECYVTVKYHGSAKPVVINTDLLKSYYKQMAELSAELHTETESVLGSLLRLPEIVSPSNEVLSDEEWLGLKGIFEKALKAINAHREDEGHSLDKELRLRIKNIGINEQEVALLEPRRKEKIKGDLEKVLSENVGKDNYDSNRLEQEIIYYIEKIDIREEQVRLRNHCKYFISILDGEEDTNGKKLAFVLQEIGREINTTGSKAYDADIQRSVVNMKDELEKAKEQTFNVL